jgi:Ni/Co efflux regulator RcnB
MKKMILGLVAASLAATPALAAPNGPRHGVQSPQRGAAFHHPGYRASAYHGYRQWQRGQRFDARYARNYRSIDYRQHRRLQAPPRGYRWVQSGNDAVLVGIASGLVAAVLASALN